MIVYQVALLYHEIAVICGDNDRSTCNIHCKVAILSAGPCNMFNFMNYYTIHALLGSFPMNMVSMSIRPSVHIKVTPVVMYVATLS